MNLAFYVSRKATRLKKILDMKNEELIDSIKVAFSDDKETLYLKDKLEELNISYVYCDYKKIPSSKSSKNLMLSNILLKTLEDFKIAYCFSFGSHILEGELLEAYKNRIINFHPSILPLFPGQKAIDQAVEVNSNLLGNTAHFIDAGIDTGPIILQSVIPIKAFIRNGYDAVLDIQIEMLNIIFDLLKNKRIKIIDGKVHIDEADYCSYAIFPHIDPSVRRD